MFGYLLYYWDIFIILRHLTFQRGMSIPRWYSRKHLFHTLLQPLQEMEENIYTREGARGILCNGGGLWVPRYFP